MIAKILRQELSPAARHWFSRKPWKGGHWRSEAPRRNALSHGCSPLIDTAYRLRESWRTWVVNRPTTMTYFVREQKFHTKEMPISLSHRAGHMQIDFGETFAVINEAECNVHFSIMSLPHSGVTFVKKYLTETVETFCDGRLLLLRRHPSIDFLHQHQDHRCTNTQWLGLRGKKREKQRPQ